MVRQESLSLHATLPPAAAQTGHTAGGEAQGPALTGCVPRPGGRCCCSVWLARLCWDAEFELIGRRGLQEEDAEEPMLGLGNPGVMPS